MLNRDWSTTTFQEDSKVDSLCIGSIMRFNDWVANVRYLNNFFKLNEIFKRSIVNMERVLIFLFIVAEFKSCTAKSFDLESLRLFW